MAAYVRQRLEQLLSDIDDNHPMFGPLEHGKLQMPRSSPDGRKQTWTKLIHKLSNKVCTHPNLPLDDDWCWFVPANDYDSHDRNITRHRVAVGPDQAHRTHYPAHRLTYALLDPGMGYHAACGHTPQRAALKCHHGTAYGPYREYRRVCINPFHGVLVSSVHLENDRMGCLFGCNQLCPHNPKCFWTRGSTGEPLNCFNLPVLPKFCECGIGQYCMHFPLEGERPPLCQYGSKKLCPHSPKCSFRWPDTLRRKPCFYLKEEIPPECPHDRPCKHVPTAVDQGDMEL